MFGIFRRKKTNKNVKKTNQIEMFISKWQEVKTTTKEYDKLVKNLLLFYSL